MLAQGSGNWVLKVNDTPSCSDFEGLQNKAKFVSVAYVMKLSGVLGRKYCNTVMYGFDIDYC